MCSCIIDTYYNHSMLIIILGQIKSMFEVEYSELGSRKRHTEEQTYIFFSDFLDQCEGNQYTAAQCV